jgi:transposase
MLTLAPDLKIYVYTRPTDMRNGINGLSGIVRDQFSADPTDGSLFVFINRRCDRLKMLYFDGGGFWLYYRVLEAGTFETISAERDSPIIEMDTTQLAMLLAGVSLMASKRRRKRFFTDTSACAA